MAPPFERNGHGRLDGSGTLDDEHDGKRPDVDRTGDDDAPDRKARFVAADAGFIAQNVYLFCASAGLATVVRGLVDHAALGKALRLGSRQQIILAQSVGYPAGGR